MRRRTVVATPTRCHVAVLVASCSLFGAGVDVSDQGWHRDLYLVILGATLIVGAMLLTAILVVWLTFARLFRPIEDLWEDGCAAGYRKGWLDGRKAGKPEVISLKRRR